MVLVTKDFSIVIADDDQDDRDFIKDALKRREYSGGFRCMENGVELLKYLKETGATLPKLILLDLNMPLKDGYQALAEIKQDEVLRSIPVVILTSSSKPEDEPICFNLGAEQFFRKPLSMDEYDELASGLLQFIGKAS